MSIEPKVTAATGGATAAAAACWVLTQFVFHGALPVPVEALVDVVVPGAVALLGGYLTPHQDRPPTGAALPSSPSPVQQAAAAPDPARPPVVEQHTEIPTPKENPMSVLDQFRTLVEQLRGELVSKVGTEVADDVHAAVDLFKGQAAQMLIEAGHDAQADASQVISNVATVATDAASAVTPAPVETAPADPAAPTA